MKDSNKYHQIRWTATILKKSKNRHISGII